MWLKLVNFRCHEDKEIKIPDTGFCGLSANVGSGKTTILMGITYALYGKIPSKAKKVTTHGKTSTSVYLKYKEMSIERHSKPKRLIVEYGGSEYEGDAAQSIIHTIIGATYDEFLLSSYVVQRGYVSILSLSPAEQVNFIETIANTLSENYKLSIKKKIKEYSSILINLQGQLQSLTDQKELKEQKYPEIPDVPTVLKKGESPEDIRNCIQSLEKSLRKTENLHSIMLEKYTVAVKKEKETLDALKKMEATKTKIAHIQENLDKEILLLRDIHIPEDLGALEDKINLLNIRREYLEEKKKLDHTKKEYEESRRLKLDELKKKILPKAKLSELKNSVDQAERDKMLYDAEVEKWEADQERKVDLKNTLSEIFICIKDIYENDITSPKEMFDYLKQEEEYIQTLLSSWERKNGKKTKCPCCGEFLTVTKKMEVLKYEDDNNLPENYQTRIENIDSLKDWISKLEEINPIYYSIKNKKPEEPKSISKLEEQKKKYQDAIACEYKYTELLKTERPSIIDFLEKKVKKLETQSRRAIEFSETLEELLGKKKRVDEELGRKNRLELSIKSNKATIKTLEGTIEHIPAVESSAQYQKKLSSVTEKIMNINAEIGAKRKVLDSVSDYEKYLENIKEIELLEESISSVKFEIQKIEQKLEGFYGLEQVQKEAEIISLEETVNTINEYAKFYLDKIFEMPIVVKLSCVKQKGKNYKLQITNKIFYKNQEYDCIDELSGGERQQADIAYMLAISDMFNTGLLFLDECLNEMDSTLNTQTLMLLRELRKEKLTLVISHEAVRGVYEKEITLE